MRKEREEESVDETASQTGDPIQCGGVMSGEEDDDEVEEMSKRTRYL